MVSALTMVLNRKLKSLNRKSIRYIQDKYEMMIKFRKINTVIVHTIHQISI